MADQTLARLVNERSILTLLRRQGSATRAGLARALGLTPATITRLTSDLLARGMLREVTAPDPARTAAATAGAEGPREPGRPGITIAINPPGACFLGVEIGVNVVRVVLIDLAAQVVAQKETRLAARLSPRQAADAVAQAVTQHSADPRWAGRIRGVGVTLPGLVTDAGYVVNLPILGWRGVDFSAALQAATGLPCRVENNANAAAFGAVYGSPMPPAACTLFVKLGTGCGGAVIAGGRLLRGADGTALELGHIRTGSGGRPCSCSQTGCLETRVNLAALARDWAATSAPDADLSGLPDRLAAAALGGDAAARRVIDRFADHLTAGLVMLVNLFNPGQILLGGMLRPVTAIALPRIGATLARRIIPGTRMPLIVPSPLGDYECAIGAACLSHQLEFGLPDLGAGPFPD